MQCVILAGGLGTRIRDVAGDGPKSLIPVHGKPFIAYQLEWLHQCGVTDIVLCIGYQGRRIYDFVGDGDAWNVRVTYVDEKDQLRGTGGAVRLAADQGKLQPAFFLMYGDSYLPVDFGAINTIFNERPEPALMTVMHNFGQWDQSNARFDGSRVTCYDKKQKDGESLDYIDYGLSMLRTDPLMTEIPRDTVYDLARYFSTLSRKGLLAGLEIKKRFYEIGSPQGLSDFKMYVSALAAG